jgi:hypothetical protein
VVAIHFDATNPKRRPLDSLLHDILDYSTPRDAGIILLGDEHEIAAKLMDISGHHSLLFQGNLNDLKYLLSKVDLFIGPCSGPLQMVAAVDTPEDRPLWTNHSQYWRNFMWLRSTCHAALAFQSIHAPTTSLALPNCHGTGWNL